MEQDRAPRHPEHSADRPGIGRAAQRQFPGRPGGQLPWCAQPADRRPSLPAELDLQRELWLLRRSARGRSIRQDAARDRLSQAARFDARFRKIRARYPGPRHLGIVVVPNRALPVIRQGMEYQPGPLHKPRPRDGLARQIIAAVAPVVNLRATTLTAIFAAAAIAVPAIAGEPPKYGGT